MAFRDRDGSHDLEAKGCGLAGDRVTKPSCQVETGHALGLNETGSYIFGGVAEGRRKDDIVEGLVTRFRAPADDASRAFDELLYELQRRSVVSRA